MVETKRKLGIIAGGGQIPRMLIDECIARGLDYFVLAIEGNAEKQYITDDIPHKWLRIGQAGTGFATFRKEKVQDVIMIGTIKRPTFSDLVPDFKTTIFFAKIAAKSLGDDGILRALANDIEKQGMKIRGVHEIMSELLVKKGVLTKVKPDKKAISDIKRGIEVVTELGKLDVGQAAIIQQGLVLAVEGIEGTDALILRSKDYHRKGDRGVLVKLRKPTQDMRLDLPTIGLKTVESAIEAGLRGIVVHAENALFVDEKEAIELANKHGIFIIGIDPSEYER